MKITFEQIQKMIQRAEKHNACNQQLNILKSLKTIDEFLNHSKAPYWLYWYAKNIIKDRWPEAEEYIKINPRWAYWYASNIIKGRWLEAEEYIKKDPEWAYCYDRHMNK